MAIIFILVKIRLHKKGLWTRALYHVIFHKKLSLYTFCKDIEATLGKLSSLPKVTSYVWLLVPECSSFCHITVHALD